MVLKRVWTLSLLLMAGCSSDPPRLRSDAEIQDIAEDVAEDKFASLRTEISELREKIEELEADQRAASSHTEAVAAQVARNAEVANQNAVRDMTARGACGREWRQTESGEWFQINKRCTSADLVK